MRFTNFFDSVDRLTSLVDKCELQRVQGEVLDLVSRPQDHKFDVALDLDLAYKAVRVLLRPRSKRERVLSLPVNWNTAKMLPLFADNLHADTVASAR